jgi:ABC-2 type transport system ATP-binding protein
MPEKILEVNNLSKEFKGKSVVNNLSFTVNKGEIVGLLGANGAGKTTTMHMLLGLIKPNDGQIKIFGQDLQKHRIKILKRMNFASAYQSLSHNFSIQENLNIFADIYEVEKSKERIEYLLEIFEITDLRHKRMGGLSSGETTRANLCKALLNNPELLLLDEPTASLDPYISDKVRKILIQMQTETNMTIINTSHNMIDIHELCHRILFMQKGKIIAQGSADEIMSQFDSETLDQVYISLSNTHSK